MTKDHFDWEPFLSFHRDRVVDEWQRRLGSEVSERYARRSTEELTMTTGKAFDAFCVVLAGNDYSAINAFINEITAIRLDAGFPLADVQKAFELFRQIILPLLIEETPPALLYRNIEAINTGLAYTIHRFSSHFQDMHETYLKEYAKRLENDVAERTAELKDSEQQYKTLVEDISDGYLVLYKGMVSLVNPAFCRMHDVTQKEAFQKPFLDFVAPRSLNIIQEMIARDPVEGGEPEAVEYLRRKKDGTNLPTEINLRPSWFKGQEYLLCIVRDITKRVQMERESRELERMAYIGQLTASLSHEIRNPLSSVKMNLQILGKNSMFQGNDKRRLDISEREINRLEGILKELLDFAKPVALKRKKTNVNQLICDCVELLEVRIIKQNIDCRMRLDDTIPLLKADIGRLEQVVINLLLNALESVGESGQINIFTQTGQVEDHNVIVIRIEDDGKGISRKQLNHIYEPFYTTKTSGTGLGLANVKRIVEAHNGLVSVVDAEISGTAFEVWLPVDQNISLVKISSPRKVIKDRRR